MAQTVAETLVGVLEHIGVKQIFVLIGDSLNPLADAVRTQLAGPVIEDAARQRAVLQWTSEMSWSEWQL